MLCWAIVCGHAGCPCLCWQDGHSLEDPVWRERENTDRTTQSSSQWFVFLLACVCLCVCARLCVHVCMRMYTHTHTYMCIHTCAHAPFLVTILYKSTTINREVFHAKRFLACLILVLLKFLSHASSQKNLMQRIIMYRSSGNFRC